jgi:hypothetical protein
MTKAKLPAVGSFEPPPPNAPHETSQPLKPEALAAMAAKAAKAAANEQDLTPLEVMLKKAAASVAGAQSVNPHGVVTAPPHAAPGAPSGSASLVHAGLADQAGPPSPDPSLDKAGPSGEGVSSPPLSPHALPALPPDATPEEIADPVVNARPARGQPKPIGDPGKVITGGWGPDLGASAPQYYALDGSEIKALAISLMEDLKKEMDRDLRFHLAMTYPQAFVRVTVEVAGATEGAAINDVAFTLASRIVRLAVSAADTQETPADLLRDQTGLPKPFKHQVQTTTGPQFVDRE